MFDHGGASYTLPTEHGSNQSRYGTLPNNKILCQSKLKEFADNKFNVAQMVQIFFDRIENTVGNVTTMFSKGFSAGRVVKPRDSSINQFDSLVVIL